ncbi:MAG: Rrf2 family transcriptional regulator [Firmicutes bacterium]|nr:Rrf2 family transcriptional regulator [Bacillota bacterium]
MKISSKGRHGLLLMVDLASTAENAPVSLRVVAQHKGLSEHYLEQLIGPLRKAQLVTSVRGVRGGYQLGRPADEISAGDVLRALAAYGVRIEEAGADLDPFWERLRGSIEQVLDTTTIADLTQMWKGRNPDSLLMEL